MRCIGTESPSGLRSLFVAGAVVLLSGPTFSRCGGDARDPGPGPDPHSFARPGAVVVDHVDLELSVDFASRALDGLASLHVRNRTGTDRLHLDVRDIDLESVAIGRDPKPAAYRLGEPVEYLGRPLVVEIEPDTEIVHVRYRTRPEAMALQWIDPEQTAGGVRPFLLTQSQSVFARSWVPCQDTPSVRFTYDATVRVPAGLLALMSAENPRRVAEDGIYRFHMPQRIPSYLLALAVGDLRFRPLGGRSGVYAEPELLERAAWEFAETEAMMEAAESLYGAYRWGRYDLLVLPPGFPFGGMENPRLTFVTPTVLAGDRSLVSLVAHELAHSWSGNLVTNATWSDFWLNEGFTNYLESRIMEVVYGREFAEMNARLGVRELERILERIGHDHPDTRLAQDLDGRDAEDSFTGVPYNKGYLFLRLLEEAVGREAWDRFLAGYFERHAFRTMTSERFLQYLREELLDARPGLERRLDVEDWLFGTGLPANRPEIVSRSLDDVDRARRAFAGGTPAEELGTEGWSSQQWVHFLRGLPHPLAAARMAELDAAFGFTATGNSEILHAWLLRAIEAEYDPAYGRLEAFLTGQGRLKFLRPLYAALAGTEAGRERARAVYDRARATYHPVARLAIDRLLAPESAGAD